jgi:hypothetical protein
VQYLYPRATTTSSSLAVRLRIHADHTWSQQELIIIAQQGCTPFTLPSGGIIQIDKENAFTLKNDVLFTPACSPLSAPTEIFADSGITGITDVKDPFHASVTPQVYATAAATVIAWMLVIMLVITPRTYFVGGAGGGFGILNRHGMIGGSQGSASVIGVGSRPWLQKVAALTVAISLTVATADTFKVAAQQYSTGFMNAAQLRSKVVNSIEIKVTRITSDIFVWLAQVQTLIRLFPRHKEKVLIKWIGFALIVLDTTFTALNSFMGNPIGRPARFRDAIPALTYLFTLSLCMLYAAWVVYYAICKRKYAFYHKNMPNIFLVALLSIVAILTPVIFFITDIANQTIAGWGDYFRWVGAAAASVIVWEWVERIEALEREEKKDGILGREVFDGDDMLGSEDSEEVIWPRPRGFWASQGWKRGGSRGGGSSGTGGFNARQDEQEKLPPHRTGQTERAIAYVKSKTRRSPERAAKKSAPQAAPHNTNAIPVPPPAAISPVSRADTTSPASTVYTIRYHNANTPIPPTPKPQQNFASLNQTMQTSNGRTSPTLLDEKLVIEEEQESTLDDSTHPSRKFHIGSINPFKRRKFSPPEEVRAGQVIDPVSINKSKSQPAHDYSAWDFKGRIGAFAADQGDKWREKKRGDEKEKDLPVTIIPAQPRGRTWSPDSAAKNAAPERAVEEPAPSTAGGVTFDSSEATAVEGSPSAGSASAPFVVREATPGMAGSATPAAVAARSSVLPPPSRTPAGHAPSPSVSSSSPPPPPWTPDHTTAASRINPTPPPPPPPQRSPSEPHR